jgi:pimeloyl-ACP methyl ester carboxylesterase
MLPRDIRSKAKYGVDKFVKVDGYQLHYVEVGVGKPVLMIPGSNNTYRAWDRLVSRLSDAYRLLPLDYLGVGDSDKPKEVFRYTIEGQTDILAKMITQLRLAPAHVVGASYGGVIALSLGYRYPELVDRIVSIEGAVVKPEKLPGGGMRALLKVPVIGDLFILLVRSGILNRLVMRLVAGKWYTHMTPQDKQEMLEQLSCNSRSATRHAWYGIEAALESSRDMEEEAKALRAPTLYLYGTASDDFRPMIGMNLPYFAKYMPTVKATAIQDGIHDSAFQKPDEVAQLIREFLAGG